MITGIDYSQLWTSLPQIQPPKPTPKTFPVKDILTMKYEVKNLLYKLNRNVGIDTDSGDYYQKYLQVGNKRIVQLATEIVMPTDTDDAKMWKIEQWVKNNIKYQSDIRTYKQAEYWAYPVETLARRTGDCEDGAFLIHSLGIAAGINPQRIRTYGGFVQEEAGIAKLSGHAWTAVQRRSDNEWTEIDWCYYPTDEPVEDRQPLRADLKYVDDFFYINSMKTVDMTLGNRIRQPGGIVNVYV